MSYANVSVKFPRELDREIERFLGETGVYTNKSEFIKEACRRRLEDLNNEPAIAALRLEQLLTRAEDSEITPTEIDDRLATLGAAADADGLTEAVEAARRETSGTILDPP